MARGKFQKKPTFRLAPILIILIAIALVIFFMIRILEDPARTPTGPEETIPPITTTVPQETETEPPTTEPPTEPTTEPPTEPFIVSTASVGVTGDILIHSPVYNAAYQGSGVYDFRSMFTYIAEYYESFDYMIANLEVTLSGADIGYSSYPLFNCPDAIADALVNAGVDMALTANNHTYDKGHKGLIRTQEVLTEKGLDHLGTRTSEELPFYTIQDINGIQVGMVCYTYETGNTSDGRKTLNGIPVDKADGNLISSFNPYDLGEFYEDVENVLAAMEENGAEATMLFIHWGNEYQTKQTTDQTLIAQKLAELGVDVLVGGHPHVIQPFDTIVTESGHTMYCIYSLGNALSNQRRTNIESAPNGHTEDSMIFSVTFEKWNDGSVKIQEIDILPIWVSKGWDNAKGNEYYIIPLDLENSNWEDFDISDTDYLYGSYKRTMQIVGNGLNEARESLGLPTKPLTAEQE